MEKIATYRQFSRHPIIQIERVPPHDSFYASRRGERMMIKVVKMTMMLICSVSHSEPRGGGSFWSKFPLHCPPCAGASPSLSSLSPSSLTTFLLQSICDAKEIPHIETRWDYRVTPYNHNHDDQDHDDSDNLEDQNQKNHGSMVALLSRKFLQIRKVFATRHMFSQNWPVGKETVWTIHKLSGQSGNCSNNLKTVRIIQKLSGQPQNCPDNSKTVPTI